jgi:hypothetical protein
MRQEYKVIQPFTATEPISGNQQKFTPGDIVVCDPAQNGTTLTLETGGSFTLYFLVDRQVFEICCKWINRGGGPM